MPSQHMGHFGTALSPFDMRHMSSALPDYPQQRYGPSQPQVHISQASAGDPLLAYSPYSHQQFANQSSGPYAPHHSQQSQPPLSRGYPGYNPNIQNSSPDTQSRGQMFLPQQQMGYSLNMPHQLQYPTFVGHQGQYGHMPMNGYQARMGAAYQMPRLQVDSPLMPSGHTLHSQHAQGMIAIRLRLTRSNGRQSYGGIALILHFKLLLPFAGRHGSLNNLGTLSGLATCHPGLKLETSKITSLEMPRTTSNPSSSYPSPTVPL